MKQYPTARLEIIGTNDGAAKHAIGGSRSIVPMRYGLHSLPAVLILPG